MNQSTPNCILLWNKELKIRVVIKTFLRIIINRFFQKNVVSDDFIMWKNYSYLKNVDSYLNYECLALNESPGTI